MAHPPFNPLDKRNLGESVSNALLERPVGPLLPEERFPGAGIYAIYYAGEFDAYAPIAARNRRGHFEQPIYVGKAVPPGARKGGFGLGAAPGFALCQRLREHSNSIEQARNLQVADFHCRYLISDDIWIPLGESLTIERFQPIWNVVLDGFGNHPPGGGRQRQERSRWDAVHPGRPWADVLPPHHQTSRELLLLVREFLAGRRGPILTPQQAVTEEEE
ncbi:MAG: Eco29kI family restriction endonuclease [Terriglobales bacterium]